MNKNYLDRSLGVLSPQRLQRIQNDRLFQSLEHDAHVCFKYAKVNEPTTGNANASKKALVPQHSYYVAHQAGVNCLAIDRLNGAILVSGGGEASIRLWNLEQHELDNNYLRDSDQAFDPQAALTRAELSSHTHAITSISIYPFDPVPSTLISTSHDRTLKLVAISQSNLIAIHTFDLDFAPYTHAISPVPDSTPIIAVGTAHPAVRLLDLRSGLATHSLPGHNGAIYSLAWSPSKSHVLASGAADGRVLFFDIRRANAAFASLDLDDAIGVLGEDIDSGSGARQQLLDFSSKAHNGPVTCVQWTPAADKIVTAGHDQRIRVWDATTGRSDLVHFGPRIRNERIGELKPLISPAEAGMPGHELLLWPNDDGKGDVFVHDLREGTLKTVMRTQGISRTQHLKHQSGGGGSSSVGRLTSAGRINAMVWRSNATSGAGLEMYSAHGDGRICAWLPRPKDEAAEEMEMEMDVPDSTTNHLGDSTRYDEDEEERERKRKRKRDMIGDLIEGLTKKSVTYM